MNRMTRKEAIMILENNRPSCGERIIFKESEVYEAMGMAIEALSSESCEDVVSRKAAIDECNKRGAEHIGYAIAHLPSAQTVLTCKGCKYDYYEYAGCRNCLRRERDLYEPE